MRIKTLMQTGVLLSLVFTVDAVALETMTIYQTQSLKVAGLHRIKKSIDVEMIELDKLGRLEAELTRQANIASDATESDGEKAIRGQFKQLTLNALGRAWREIVHAQQQGINIKRLPAIYFRGRVYHEVHDIRAILKP